MSLQPDSISAFVANIKLIIQASVLQSNGVTRTYNKVAAFAAPHATLVTIAIEPAYDAKNSTSTTATPKAFFKWFYVNIITSEKSDEMMGYAKLASRELPNPNLTMKRSRLAAIRGWELQKALNTILCVQGFYSSSEILYSPSGIAIFMSPFIT